MELKKIQEIVKNTLSEKRYYHSCCVMEKCEELAKIYNIDVDTAKKVGIVHDIAKEMSEEEKLKYARENNIQVDFVERRYVGLLHAKIGADIAMKRFDFNEEMCRAIRFHTTAGTDMDILAKILYVADAISKDRTWDDIEIVEKMARNNINEAVIYLLDMDLSEKIDKRKMIQVDSVLARNKIIDELD